MKLRINSPSGFIIFTIIFVKYISAIDYVKTFDNFIDKLNPPSLKDPEEYMTVPEVIQYHGYPVETYDITTEDGYILTIHRIPYGKNTSDISVPRTPVLIQHGLLDDSGIWVANIPDKNLPYLLADRGYDIWLGNFRGNNFGRRHVNRSPNEVEFWRFSFDEMGKYDLPAMIDFILNHTGFNKLHYIGYSMGTSAMFVLLSTKTEYNEKIRSYQALAPVARLDYVKSPLVLFAIPLSDQFVKFLDLVGSDELLSNSSSIDLLADSLCKWATRSICSNAIFLITGFDNVLFNASRLPVYLHFYPAGTSAQTVHHYAQISAQRRFQAHDYGEDENMERYNQAFPPLYDVTKITAPVALYWGEGDWIASPEDVEYLIKKLNNTLVLNYRVPFASFNHMDFAWATDVVSLLYEKVFETLERL